MRYYLFVLMFICFIGVIGFSVWFLESAWPLLGLIVCPTYSDDKTQVQSRDTINGKL
jgi:hypothetical protein